MRSFWLLGALCLFAASSAAQEIGKVKNLAGTVTVSRGGVIANAAPGDSLLINDIVRTGSAPGNGARVALLDASELTLGPGTELRVILHNPETQQTTIEMLHGHLRAKVTPVVKQGGIFQVRTPTAVAVALGTVVEVSTNPILTTENTQLSATVDQAQVTNLPTVSRDFGEIARTAPGMEGSMNPGAGIGDSRWQQMLAANDSILGRENYSSSLDGNLDIDTISAATDGMVSVTNLLDGIVRDVRPNASGNFHLDQIPPGNYSFRVQGFNSNYAIQTRLSIPSGVQVDLGTLRPTSANQPGNPGINFTPSYSYFPSLGAAYLQNQNIGLRFNLQTNYMPVAGATTPETPGAVSTVGFGATNFFNAETQTYNALGPYANLNPLVGSGSNSIGIDLTGSAGRGSTRYSRMPGASIGGPIYLPGFGEGSNFAGRGNWRRNLFFFPQSSNTPSINLPNFNLPAPSAIDLNREPLGFDRTFLDGTTNYSRRNEFRIDANYTYDPNPGASDPFTYRHSPQVTSSHD